MEYGAHLPLIDFDGRGWSQASLASYVDAARQLGYDFISVNDHLVFERPWLDCVVALASVIDRSGDMGLATTVSLPVIRGPAALAKAAAALDILSGGRLVLGVGPGSSHRDYEAANLSFDQRWPRLDEAIRVLRAQLKTGEPAFEGRFYSTKVTLEPRPNRPEGPPIWIGSWGSEAGLRRVARLGDGWLASAYYTTPAQAAQAREKLGVALTESGRHLDGFACSLATMWTYITEDERARKAHLLVLERLLNRPAELLSGRVFVGPAEECAATIQAYADVGFERVFIWPIADANAQLERFMREVVPLVQRPEARPR